MKTKLVGIIVIGIIALAIIGCKGDDTTDTPQEQPEYRSATVQKRNNQRVG